MVQPVVCYCWWMHKQGSAGQCSVCQRKANRPTGHWRLTFRAPGLDLTVLSVDKVRATEHARELGWRPPTWWNPLTWGNTYSERFIEHKDEAGQ